VALGAVAMSAPWRLRIAPTASGRLSALRGSDLSHLALCRFAYALARGRFLFATFALNAPKGRPSTPNGVKSGASCRSTLAKFRASPLSAICRPALTLPPPQAARIANAKKHSDRRKSNFRQFC
jgi:hypothetical protein